MNDPLYGAERSISLYVAAERERACTPTTESTLTVLAIIALLLVLATLAVGGG